MCSDIETFTSLACVTKEGAGVGLGLGVRVRMEVGGGVKGRG